MLRKILIFDTTLRDGEQCPGASMNKEEKLTVARQLARLNVDIIEAGFPVASEDDFEGVRLIAEEVRGPVIAGLARARKEDIERAGEAVSVAERSRIHTFIATSEIHMQRKLRMSREGVLEAAVAAVRLARQLTDDVEFSAEDASRSDVDFLCLMIESVINAGAGTVNIPDTVGYALPGEFGDLISRIMNRVPNVDKAVISVHCHNDLGLAVANSLSAVLSGAGQVECTINGIGERAGNASLEEVVMAFKTRGQYFDADTGINTQEIYKTSRLVSSITGMVVQPNKAIVGANAFAHESGIHQDGLLKDKRTYEIMTPESVGIPMHKLVLGKHSGSHAFRNKLEELGYNLSDEEVNKAFDRFKKVADQKKEVFEEDIEAIISEEVYRIPEKFVLKYIHVESGLDKTPSATVALEIDGLDVREVSTGDGPVDATYRTIKSITNTSSHLLSYEVKAITGGTDALGEVTVRVEEGGRTVVGQGADTDIIVASAKAYLNALNRLVYKKRK
ncbi:MAG: 2-isopropylmalate synthase [Nitrospirae bacterium]|nr:2-isopropylmalate synthase [Nitrospirota bacterium]